MSRDLRIEGLTITFSGSGGEARVIEDATLSIPAGRTVGLVGESGSGKTVIAKALLGILPAAARITAGSVHYGGVPVVSGRASRGGSLRGREIAMIFQNPKSSLNPIRTIGRQIEDVVRQHLKVSRAEARDAALDALSSVRLPDPQRIYNAYPYELSGGMAQRALIAVALSCRPSLLIADEPTTGLDVSLQREIMDLIRSMSRERGMSVLLITHDLAVAEDYCDLISVMHAGHVVETAPAAALLSAPSHPYTAALMRSTPSAITSLGELRPIRGTLPSLYGDVPSCRFLARCDRRTGICEERRPMRPVQIGPDHSALCRKPQ